MDDQQFRRLLDRLGLSWKGYRKVRRGVKNRIRRHMYRLGFPTIKAYLDALDQNPELRGQCERLMTVSISRFFRDRGLWEALETQVLPSIIKGKARLNVWVAGCACGEEVYSLQILYDRLRKTSEILPALDIWATDLNPLYLERARRGTYPVSSLRDAPEEIRTVHFTSQEGSGRYTVAPSLRKGVRWEIRNLLHDPPPLDFHMIFLRNNLLTYYNEPLKETHFQKLWDCLVPGGLLVIGSHERIPRKAANLVGLRPHPCIFQKHGPPGGSKNGKD